jgi:hypothetical protein
MLRRAALVLWILAAAPACLVVSLQPVYDEEAITWDPALLGTWQSQDDETVLRIEQDEWRSYRIHYQHPIESGDLTGYLTSVGDELYMDVMPARGEDRGAFVVPVHAAIRVRTSNGRLELTPLSYDWFLDRTAKGAPVPGLSVTLDQKQNTLITSASAALRRWLAQQPRDGPMFGGTTVFVRRKAEG